MNRKIAWILLWQLLPLTLAGCSLLEKSSPGESQSQGSGDGEVRDDGATAAGQPTGPGSVEVTVELDGEAPPPKLLDRSADSGCGEGEVADPALQVQQGRVRNAVVRVVDDLPAEPIDGALVVEPKGCLYRPRIAVVRAGQTLELRSGDATMHVTHASDGSGKTLFSQAQPPRTAPVVKKLDGVARVHLQCGTHPWSHAWLHFSPHRFAGVTGPEGVVRFADLPAREQPYHIAVWHEALGEQQLEVRVEAGRTVQARVLYPVEALGQ